jgi:hypothetical protein
MSLVWCSDSPEGNSERGDPARAKAETAGFLGIRVEGAAERGRAVWLDRLLSVPVFLGTKRRIAQFLPKK